MKSAVIVSLGAGLWLTASPPAAIAYQPATSLPLAEVHVSTSKVIRSFFPAQVLGAGVDGHEKGDIAQIYQPHNIQAMKSAGLPNLTYRLRTELGGEAWHWNPRGRWSDELHHCGYWVSDARPSPPILTCYGYRLPHRGNTIDQAANDDYSRLDDGDINTYWKSNPYLDSYFTGEPDAAHPQWIVIDLEDKSRLAELRIRWGVPFAVRYTVEYWDGSDEIDKNVRGVWRTFAAGAVSRGHGGYAVQRLCATPVWARFVRVTMTQSSRQAPAGSTDPRDGLGYAVRELALGTTDAVGRFHDAIQHGKNKDRQTHVFVSSTDPWHRASGLDPKVEQPGFDRVYNSGLTSGLPMLTPTGLLYDTPENAAAELRYLRARHYAVRRMELGEEPDGQCCAPEDYAALYLQWATALHQVDPTVELGGPSFQNVENDFTQWPVVPGAPDWLTRMLGYWRSRGRINDFNFCSFEWYPVDAACDPTMPHLLAAPAALNRAIKRLHDSGLPAACPLLMTEYGYSAFAARAEVDLAGALFNADTMAGFLLNGGATAYLYGYEPEELMQEIKCSGPGNLDWGNNTLFISESGHKIKYLSSTYHAARLVTRQWLGGAWQPQRLYATWCSSPMISTYAVQQPNGLWSLLFINRDEKHLCPVRVRIGDRTLAGQVDVYQFSQSQYAWHPRRDDGYPSPNLPAAHFKVPAWQDLILPRYSITVVQGRTIMPG